MDAFTDRPFAGNPAAVCLLDGPADEAWMQALGAEMNLSETAFLHAENDGFRLRWFTPTVEVALCGHATLASAHILWETGRLPAGATARFYTQSGLLTARRDGEWIDLDFPAVACEPAEAPSGLLEALGVKAVAVLRAGPDYVVELAAEADVRGAKPDMARLGQVDARGIAVTAPASLPGYPATTLPPVSSPPLPASPRIPSRAHSTAHWRPSGQRAWPSPISPPTKPPPEAEPSVSESPATASSSPAKPSPSSAPTYCKLQARWRPYACMPPSSPTVSSISVACPCTRASRPT